jgi:hypothetical protein
MDIFLDYYHPYAGLCNQLYLITNHIHQALNVGKKLFILKVNIDIFKKERIPCSEFLDIDKTNENLKNVCGKELLLKSWSGTVTSIPKLCIYPVSSIEILNCLEFNGYILEKVLEMKEKLGNEYYSIHFRLDLDAIIHYTFGKDIYDTFMGHEDKIGYFQTLDQKKIENYCLFLMSQYKSLLLYFGFEKTWYISTSLKKWDIHTPMEKYLVYLTDFIRINNGSFFIPNVVFPQRELNALVDLLVLRDSEKMIAFEGSSFSEGYCLKVNTIRKNIKECKVIKEYP